MTNRPDPAHRGVVPGQIAEIIVSPPSGMGRRGSGYRVGPSAILTAAHVVEGAASVRVRFDAGVIPQALRWLGARPRFGGWARGPASAGPLLIAKSEEHDPGQKQLVTGLVDPVFGDAMPVWEKDLPPVRIVLHAVAALKPGVFTDCHGESSDYGEQRG